MNAHPYQIRKFQDSDLPTLARIYRKSIHQITSEYYTEDQIKAWSSFADDTEAFKQWIKGASTFIATIGDNTSIGFGGLESHGRISSLFVSPDFSRKGIGSGLLEQLLDEAKLRNFSLITTEASELSRPLFEKYGFNMTEIEHTVIKGIGFQRYKMQAFSN